MHAIYSDTRNTLHTKMNLSTVKWAQRSVDDPNILRWSSLSPIFKLCSYRPLYCWNRANGRLYVRLPLCKQ